MKVYLLMHTAEIGQDKSTECVGVFSTKEKAQKRLVEEMQNRSTHSDQEYWQTLERETEKREDNRKGERKQEQTKKTRYEKDNIQP